jgi:predicted DNA-binding transcriptional regulator YafY
MYERVEDLLRLALLMQGSRSGVSLEDITGEFKVSRSTAERMRNAVLRAFPQAEEVPGTERVKRWRIPDAMLNRTIAVQAAELEELHLAAERLRSEGLDERAGLLDGLRAKVAALMTQAARSRMEPDLEALLEAEGHAMRPGPRPGIPEGLLATLRQALAGCLTIRARYRRRIGGRVASVELEPHGVLFGQRHYLVAFPAGAAARFPKLYALANLSDVVPTGVGFTRRKGFDLRAYASQSFGVFQEEPQEVVWHFAPELAADALEHHFHLSEQKRRLDGGGVEVRFKAGGLLEMCWHLFTWGPGVEVVSPAALRDRYAALLDAALGSAAPSSRQRVA